MTAIMLRQCVFTAFLLIETTENSHRTRGRLFVCVFVVKRNDLEGERVNASENTNKSEILRNYLAQFQMCARDGAEGERIDGLTDRTSQSISIINIATYHHYFDCPL